MIFATYRLLLRPAAPVLKLLLRRRLRLGKEDPARLSERWGQSGCPRPEGPLVWMHGASVGEALSLLSLVTLLRRNRPDINLLMTTGTVTSARLMARRLPEGVLHQYVPVDHPVWVARFIAHWRPDAVLWSESELWPNLLGAVKARDIPAALVNARMSQRSFRRWRRVPRVAGKLLAVFRVCLAQNKAEGERLRALGAGNVIVSGNLKYAAAPLPDDAPARAALQAAVGPRPMVLWASTHAGEEDMAGRVHRILRETAPDLLTVIVPRHPSRAAGIRSTLTQAGLRVAARAAGDAIETSTDIYLADTMGELGLFYRLCPTVVMGGTFADVGGHNPIEPAQVGAVIYCGPQLYNFLSIRDDFREAQAMIEVANENALAAALAERLRDPAATDRTGANASAWTARQYAVLDRVYEALAPLLPAQNPTTTTEEPTA